MEAKLIVHGGAWNIPAELHAAHVAGVRRAVSEVFPKLQGGMSALDAVEAAVKVMEEDPTFDAGRGSVLNAQGEIEMDAMIMNGTNLSFGAVASVQNILHPITAARLVMEKTEHCFLVSEGAQRFARKMELFELAPQELLSARELAFYEEVKNDPSFSTRDPFDALPRGTVGAVALDKRGHLAAATSTGGTPRKLPGRVGDTPIVGAGTYANDERGAASATGWGEAIMKIVLCKVVCDLLQEHSAASAAEIGIDLLDQRVQGLGGVIVIDKRGGYGFTHNTPYMAFAYAQPSGEIVAKINKETL